MWINPFKTDYIHRWEGSTRSSTLFPFLLQDTQLDIIHWLPNESYCSLESSGALLSSGNALFPHGSHWPHEALELLKDLEQLDYILLAFAACSYSTGLHGSRFLGLYNCSRNIFILSFSYLLCFISDVGWSVCSWWSCRLCRAAERWKELADGFYLVTCYMSKPHRHL